MRRASLTLFTCALALCAQSVAGEFNPTLSIGDKAPAWTKLPDVDGKAHSLSDLANVPLVVVVFTCNSCPYAVDYEDRLVAFQKEIVADGRKVSLVAINVNKIDEDSPEQMKKRAQAKGFRFPYLFDETQKIAEQFGATRTPEFFVLDKDRNIVYMGAMDDSSMTEKVKQRYLRSAVESLLAGEKIATAETPPVGCAIRFEKARRKPKRSSS